MAIDTRPPSAADTPDGADDYRRVRIPVPEPDLTPEALIERARSLRPMLLEAQADADWRGHYGPEIHEAFTTAGFYRCLQPRRWGGYEFDVPTFYRLIVEVARGGGGGIGWCLCLGSNHALDVPAHWSERAQAEVFGANNGHFVAPMRSPPGGTAVRENGGYRVKGHWSYSSGVPYATHFTGSVRLVDPEADPDSKAPPSILVILVPREQFTILDDWGGHVPNAPLGLQGSGSNTVVIEDTWIPEHSAVINDWNDPNPAPAPGVTIHANPMYFGRTGSLHHGELASVAVGTARAALDEYERITLGTPLRATPDLSRAHSILFQQPFGEALALVDAAEMILLRAGETYMAYCRAAVAGERPYTQADDTRLLAALQQAGRLCWEAVEPLFRTAGARLANADSRLQRYFRDIAMYRVQASSHEYVMQPAAARAHFGLPVGPMFAG